MRRNPSRKLAEKLNGKYWIDQDNLTAEFARCLILVSGGALFGYCIALAI